MRESSTNNQRVSVLFYYDGDEEYARPVRLMWRGHEYELGPVKFWHTTNHDKQLLHHYSISDIDNELTFQLAMETENLTWTLERVSQQDEVFVPTAAPAGQLIGALA